MISGKKILEQNTSKKFQIHKLPRQGYMCYLNCSTREHERELNCQKIKRQSIFIVSVETRARSEYTAFLGGRKCIFTVLQGRRSAAPILTLNIALTSTYATNTPIWFTKNKCGSCFLALLCTQALHIKINMHMHTHILSTHRQIHV